MLDPDAAVAGPGPIRDILGVVRGTQLAALLCHTVWLAHCRPHVSVVLILCSTVRAVM